MLLLVWLTIFRTHAGDIECASPQMHPKRTWVLLHMLFALHYAHTYFSQKQEPRPTPDDERGGLRFGGVAPLIILGSCPFLVHYRHDDPNGRYHRYLAAHAPAGAISWPPTLCFNTAIVALSINSISGLL